MKRLSFSIRMLSLLLGALVSCLSGASILSFVYGATPHLAPALPSPHIPSWGWQTLETPHFLVHYPPGEEQLARRVAWAGEEAHRTLLPKLRYLPEEKTHVVLADVSDMANALTSVTPYNQIIVYPVFPDNIYYDTGISARTRDWFGQLILHEYAHVLHQDMSTGSTEQLRRLFGKLPWTTTPNALQGAAVIEGYATWEESSTGWGRGNDALYDMYLRIATLNGRIPHWDQVLGNYSLSGWQPGPPSYLFGYSFLDYVAKVYGEEKLAEIHWRHAEQPYSGPSEAFEYVLHIKFPQLWQEWQEALVAHYALSTTEPEPIKQEQTIDTVGDVALWPSWRPDGKAIIYGSTGGVVPGLRLRTIDDGKISAKSDDLLLTNGQIDRSNGYTWLPDGSGVIYGKLEYEQGRLLSDLYLYKLRLGKEERLTRGYRAYAPTASPSGDWIAFLGRREDVSRILVMHQTQRQPLVLWAPSNDDTVDAPQQVISLAWSPRGDRLAFAARDRYGRVDIYLLPITMTDEPRVIGAPQRLMEDQAFDADPAWSPDGRQLYFTSDRGGIYNIHVFEMDSNKLYQVTRVVGGAFSPAVSPSGRSIAFTSYSANGYDLSVLSVDSSNWNPWPQPDDSKEKPANSSVSKINQPSVTEVSTPDLTIRLSDDTTKVNRSLYLGKAVTKMPVRPPWEEDLTRAVSPQDFIIRPYSAAESLTPRYWAPAWAGVEGTWLTGGSTSAVDALGRHSYELSVSLGQTASFQLGYEYRPGALGTGAAIGLSFAGTRTSNQSDLPEEEWSLPQSPAANFGCDSKGLIRNRLQVSAQWNQQQCPSTYIFPNSQLMADSSQVSDQVGSLRATDAGRVYIRWNWPGVSSDGGAILQLRDAAGEYRSRDVSAALWGQNLGGNGLTRRNSAWTLQAMQRLQFPPAETAIVATWEGSQYQPKRYKVSLSTALGASQLEYKYVLSSDAGNWQVRGLTQEASGQLAARATAETQIMAWNIERGVGEYPLFLENVSWVLFTDAAAVANVGCTATSVISAGAEIRITANTGFGTSQGDIRVGAARDFTNSTPWQAYFGVGLGF